MIEILQMRMRVVYVPTQGVPFYWEMWLFIMRCLFIINYWLFIDIDILYYIYIYVCYILMWVWVSLCFRSNLGKTLTLWYIKVNASYISFVDFPVIQGITGMFMESKMILFTLATFFSYQVNCWGLVGIVFFPSTMI